MNSPMMKNEFKINLNLNIEVKSSKLKEILEAFKKAVVICFQEFVQQVLLHYANEYMKSGELAKMLNCKKATWKTSIGNKLTKIMTIFGIIHLPQLQVKIDDKGKRKIITRILLGIEPRKIIPEITIMAIGLMGSLATYRVVRKIAGMFANVGFSLMTILRCVRKTGEIIKFNVDKKQQNKFYADGTGLPIIKSGKRGKELKVLAQMKKDGKIQVTGMIIGKYNSGWDKLFKPLIESLKTFNKIFLVTDGDDCILKGIEGIKVILQRCLFHIPYEAKYTLWQDKIKRKSKAWIFILTKLIDICNVRKIKEDESIAKKTIENKKRELEKLIEYCEENKALKTSVYLKNASNDIFTGVEKKVMGVTTSLLERMMRTINMRINLGQWSTQSALAISKIRGAYYYNGFDV
jgi:hypothetical protein